MSDWNEDKLHHKYDPLPDEPRHRKKSKKRHVRSDHKHDYEKVCVDVHMEIWHGEEKRPWYRIRKRCKVCGRVGSYNRGTHEIPKGMPLYDVGGLEGMFATELGEELRVR